MSRDPVHRERPNAPERLRRVPEDSTRRCQSCDYPLRGLDRHGRCPECGAPVHTPQGTSDRALSEMPLELIHRLRLAAALVAVALIGHIALRIVVAEQLLPRAATLALLLSVAGWIAGTTLLTRPVTGPVGGYFGIGRAARIRRVAAWGQLAWVVASVPEVVTLVTGSAARGTELQLVQAAGVLLGLAALGVFIVHLRRIAEFVRDDEAERCLMFTFWGVPIFAVMATIFAAVPRLGFLSAAMLIASILALPCGLLMLARSMSWSVTHHRERVERDARRAAREAAHDAEIDRRLSRMD